MKSYTYPPSKTVKQALVQTVKENCLGKVIRGNGQITGFDLNKKNIQEVDDLILWVKNILPKVSFKFAQLDEDFETISQVGYDINAFQIKECWGVIYNKGDGVISHNHFPHTLSFIYFVNMPDDSSPLIIEGEEMESKEGTVLFFLSNKYHEVKEISSNGRCVITGNILYEK